MIAKDGSHLIDAFAAAAILDVHLIGGADAQLDIGEHGFIDVIVLEESIATVRRAFNEMRTHFHNEIFDILAELAVGFGFEETHAAGVVVVDLFALSKGETRSSSCQLWKVDHRGTASKRGARLWVPRREHHQPCSNDDRFLPVIAGEKTEQFIFDIFVHLSVGNGIVDDGGVDGFEVLFIEIEQDRS